MTKKEIVQELRCCASGESEEECPFTKKYGCDGCPKVSADLIERLTAENVALREKVPQWTSVEDRLPSPGARVLITDGVFVGEGFLVGKAFFGRGEGTSWKRYSNIPWDKSMKTEITHWMPLPGAPKFADLLRGAPDAPAEGGKHE